MNTSHMSVVAIKMLENKPTLESTMNLNTNLVLSFKNLIIPVQILGVFGGMWRNAYRV